MSGMGTLINVAAILVGGLCGLLFGNRMEERYQETLMAANGICVMFVGIGGGMEKLLKVGAEGLTSSGTMMMIVSCALGAVLGEWLNLERRMEQFGEWLKLRTRNERDSRFVDAFVTSSLTVCIGAMAVVGSIQDGLLGDYTVLTAKAILDLVIILVMTASMGKGCIFSAVPVALFQGGITAASRFLEPLMTPQALDSLSLVGSLLIFCVGLNLVFGKKIRAANLLPAIVVAAAAAWIP